MSGTVFCNTCRDWVPIGTRCYHERCALPKVDKKPEESKSLCLLPEPKVKQDDFTDTITA